MPRGFRKALACPLVPQSPARFLWTACFSFRNNGKVWDSVKKLGCNSYSDALRHCGVAYRLVSRRNVIDKRLLRGKRAPCH
jgi:hypothetical protein